ncbi:Mitochondrial ribosome protein 63 [Fasciolopsis buskii]|uniref:Mitochondrial ribosome protein 63 n=1 Tax=Fasciolopsis buskii TaxID=27845 RepID=A0A8E0VF11_9TREM|nr:Mitochondrial ribosome protein 63 [Fasciolopsis buski]
MRLTRSSLGRFIPWRSVPGSLWGGKQRKIPRLTHSRKAAFLDELLVCQQNHQYLQNPYVSPEAEKPYAEEKKRLELARENQHFYDRYAEQFNRRFVTRKLEETWTRLASGKRFDL